MSVSTTSDVYFDPYDVEINANPYPTFARLREEAPLYYNEQHDFYALSRFADVNKGLVDHETFSSAPRRDHRTDQGQHRHPLGRTDFRGSADPHRASQAAGRGCSPHARSMRLEPKIREFCAQSLDPLVGAGKVDFIKDFGAIMPMRVISALLGIPEDDQEMIRDHGNDQLRTEARQADEGGSGGPGRRLDLRDLHRLAQGQSVRRHHDRSAQRRVHRRARGRPQAHPRGTAHLHQRGGGRRQRDHHAADRLGGKGAGRASGAAAPAGREPRAHPSGHRRTAAVRAAGPARRPLRHP